MARTELEVFKKALEKTKKGQFLEAIKLYDELIHSTTSAYSVITQDSFKISEWEYLQDISECEKLVNSSKASFEGLMALSLLFKIVCNYDRRNMFLKQAIKLNSNDSRVWREYGQTAFHLGNIRNAIQYFQEALNLDSNDSISLEGTGLCYYYLDEPLKAINPLKKALSLKPENHYIMNHLAFILSELGELDTAMEYIQKALLLDQMNIIYLDTYACILFLQEKYDQSLVVFEKILSNKAKDWEISWDILTNLYEVLGLHVKAKQLEEKLFL
ncbi:MAG: tetratricopeptide repeat protein [Candidatus Heimdallarchaeota archaeon]